jgi:hypothetical protein
LFCYQWGVLLFSAFKSRSDIEKAQLVSEFRTYLDKNVKPVMQPQRDKLELLLTPGEKTEISLLNGKLRLLIIKRNQSGIGFITSADFSFSEEPEFTTFA